MNEEDVVAVARRRPLKPLTIRLTKQEDEALTAFCKRHKLTKAAVVRAAILITTRDGREDS